MIMSNLSKDPQQNLKRSTQKIPHKFSKNLSQYFQKISSHFLSLAQFEVMHCVGSGEAPRSEFEP